MPKNNLFSMLDSGFWSSIATGAFSVLVTLITVWSKHYLDTRTKEKKRKEDEQISTYDVDSMCEIQEFLENIKDKWNLDRVAIYQFHNGGKFFNGIAMKKFSLTYESISAGIARIKEDTQNVFVTEHPSLMRHLNTKDFFFVNADDPALDYMRAKVEEYGIIQLITVPMRSLNGSLLGFMQCSTIKQEIKIDYMMEKDLVESAQRITGYLHD